MPKSSRTDIPHGHDTYALPIQKVAPPLDAYIAHHDTTGWAPASTRDQLHLRVPLALPLGYSPCVGNKLAIKIIQPSYRGGWLTVRLPQL